MLEARKDDSSWTFSDARATLAPIGLTIGHTDDEYRVNKRGGREATAYYSSDLQDAVLTGIAMYQKGAW